MKKENKKKNNNKLFQVIAGLGAIALMSGAVLAVDAANNNGRGQGQALRQHVGMDLSDEERQEFFADMEAHREEMRQDMEVRYEAVSQAVLTGDYNAWLEVVGTDSPMAEKINADNFSTYSEGFKLMEQAREKFVEIGLDNEFGFGYGHGKMMSRRGGQMMLNQNLNNE